MHSQELVSTDASQTIKREGKKNQLHLLIQSMTIEYAVLHVLSHTESGRKAFIAFPLCVKQTVSNYFYIS